MKRRFSRTAALVICTLGVVASLNASSASASKIDDKRAQAQELQQKIAANGEKISALAEHYDEAALRLDEAKSEIGQVEARVTQAKSESNRLRSLTAKTAAAMYMSVGSHSPLDFLDLTQAHSSGRRSKYASITSDRDRQLLDSLRAATEDMKIAQGKLEEARNVAQRELDSLDSRRRDVEEADAEQARLLSSVKGEIATLVKEEETRQAAADKARSDERLRQLAAQRPAVAKQSPSSATASAPPSKVAVPNVPAPSGGAAAAVAYAKAQLGKPYRYAGVGPDSYDCSGLTMMAWAQAGVSMPHGSIAQGNMFPRVPDSELQPGDLVIYYPDHHHVGMYVGGGMTVSATQTGDFIKLQPVFRRGFQFGVRPG